MTRHHLVEPGQKSNCFDEIHRLKMLQPFLANLEKVTLPTLVFSNILTESNFVDVIQIMWQMKSWKIWNASIPRELGFHYFAQFSNWEHEFHETCHSVTFYFMEKKTPNDAATPQCQSQFTPEMKANAVPRLLSSLVWIDSGVVVSQHRLESFFIK